MSLRAARGTRALLRVVVALGLTPAVAASPAHASSITIETTGFIVGTNALVFTAAPGEANTLIVNRVDVLTAEISDTSGSPITLPAGCLHPGGVLSVAQCTSAPFPLERLRLNLGDGDDQVTHAGSSIPWQGLTILGEAGSDQLLGAVLAPCTLCSTPGTAVLDGGPNNDTLTAGPGFHELLGGSGNDTLTGGTGDDRLIGGPGGDLISGGAGADTVSYEDRTSAVSVDLASTVRSAGNSEDCRSLPFCLEKDGIGDDVETLLGGSGADTLVGDGAANAIDGGPGDDMLAGAGGPDTLTGGGGTDVLDGGPGADTMSGAIVDYSSRATPVVAAPQTEDPILGWIGPTSGAGGEGDRLRGVTHVRGGQDDDDLRGFRRIEGGPGDDTISTYANPDGKLDQAFGGPGDDTISAAAVSADGGSGNDLLSEVAGGTGGPDDDTISGTPAANVLLGGPGEDTLSGAGGDDALSGEDGADTLDGGADADSLDGGPGVDAVQGGPGADTILSRDDVPEPVVACGSEADRATTDATDGVNADCEVVAPLSLVPPQVIGTPRAGDALTASDGSWFGRPLLPEYQWEECDATGAGCAAIIGAVTARLALTTGQVGRAVRVRVSMPSVLGARSAVSDVMVVGPAPGGAPAAAPEQAPSPPGARPTPPVTCRAVRVRAGARITCLLRPAPAARTAATLRSGKRIVARGRVGARGRVTLTAKRRPEAGTYRLRVGKRTVTVRLR